MKIKLIFALSLCCFILSAAKAGQVENFTRKGYTLTFESRDSALNPAVKERMVNTFFEVYPKLVDTYNSKALKQVYFVVDTAYKGVAATSNGRVVFSSKYIKSKPGDIDVVTHEVMHIVQDYGRSVGPGWLTEGIADYVRYKFGVDNNGAGWSLPDYKTSQNYTNSYRITARFLAWLEKLKPGLVKTVNEKLHDRTYSEKLWVDLAGKSLDGLWADYSQNPVLS